MSSIEKIEITVSFQMVMCLDGILRRSKGYLNAVIKSYGVMDCIEADNVRLFPDEKNGCHLDCCRAIFNGDYYNELTGYIDYKGYEDYLKSSIYYRYDIKNISWIDNRDFNFQSCND